MHLTTRFYSMGAEPCTSSYLTSAWKNLQSNTFFSQHGRTPLINAAGKGQTDVVHYLIEHGAAIDDADEVILFHFISVG